VTGIPGLNAVRQIRKDRSVLRSGLTRTRR